MFQLLAGSPDLTLTVSVCLSRWKGPAFMITSAFLVCCELYGWTTSGHKSRQNQENFGDGGSKKEASVSDEVIREEDFPTLGEWLDDRDVLYKERSRFVRGCLMSIHLGDSFVTMAIDFIAINFDPLYYLCAGNCPLFCVAKSIQFMRRMRYPISI